MNVDSVSLTNINTKLPSSHPNKVLGFADFENGDVISGKRALHKASELQNNGAVKRIINRFISKN